MADMMLLLAVVRLRENLDNFPRVGRKSLKRAASHPLADSAVF